jgi:hypothetical protein
VSHSARAVKDGLASGIGRENKLDLVEGTNNGFRYGRRHAHPRCGPQNTEISCEDRAILALAGFVSFISLFCGPLTSLSAFLTSLTEV